MHRLVSALEMSQQCGQQDCGKGSGGFVIVLLLGFTE
jgi:hypothetical protein